MLNWIERRTGFISQAKEFLEEDIPGGASYWYVFGSATLFAMIVQIVTGIFLTFFYAPSASTAWESTRSIYTHPFQHFVLSIHYWGASAMIALLFLHMLQVVVWGAYKSPREIQWIVGVLLLLVTMVLGLTGYLLPWDMDAYFASQVAINLTLTMPVIGVFIQQFAQDGTTMGTLTINRFFGLHVWLMPAALVALVGAHLAIFRWNGPAGPPVEDPRPLSKGRFWPDQMFMDAFASFVVFLIILALAAFAPPFLDAKADPSNSTFVPYPAWYFLDLFGLLNLVPGDYEVVGAIIIPGIATTLILLLPWIDRSTTRMVGSRKPIMWLVGVSLAIMWWLTIWSQVSIQQKQAAGPASAPESQILAAQEETNINEAGGGAAPPSTSESNGGGKAAASAHAGQSVYQTNCSSCHGASGGGTPGAFPPLAGNPFVTGNAPDVIKVVLNGLHGSISVNGQTYNGQMPPWKATLSNKDVADVVTYIRTTLGTNHASPVTEADVAKLKK
ncbi:MAG TPA: cytochrome b N-terminal domain-containing protein [Candidatus Baltobacteraceae bacterium]|jgi:ubiquinol-cytochrome c reductase cytochrome b subunit|nr:cytochrome b N-terminal domain-containing protein [Candidatus Baltobacteraceae bacterium]